MTPIEIQPVLGKTAVELATLRNQMPVQSLSPAMSSALQIGIAGLVGAGILRLMAEPWRRLVKTLA